MNSRPGSTISWLSWTLALVVASGVAACVVASGAGRIPASGAALIVVAVPTLLAPLFWPKGDPSGRRLLVCIVAPLVTIALLALVWPLLQGRAIPMRLLAPACLVSLLILFVARACAVVVERVLQRFGANARTALEWSHWTITALLWLAACVPLWLGPFADLLARVDAAGPSTILASSPLVHLAVASGCDLLRTQWFYGHTSLGALQVDYPTLGALLLAYACAGVLLALLAIPFGLRPKDTSVVEPRTAQGERST